MRLPRRKFLLTRISYRRFAFTMALVGQLAVTIGLPMPVFAYPAESQTTAPVDSECGCCPMDRTAKRCCCTPNPVTSELNSCCVKNTHDASADTHARVKIRWTGGIVQKRCLGADENALSASSILVSPGAAPDVWTFDWSLYNLLPFTSESPVLMLSLPATPPPRS
jgi:hypothetical protein